MVASDRVAMTAPALSCHQLRLATTAARVINVTTGRPDRNFFLAGPPSCSVASALRRHELAKDRPLVFVHYLRVICMVTGMEGTLITQFDRVENQKCAKSHDPEPDQVIPCK